MDALTWPLADPDIWPPHQIALRTPQVTLTAAELDGLVDCAIVQIEQQGIAKGAHIGCAAHNSLSVVVLLLACIKGGWVYAPLNPRYPQTQQHQLMDELDIAAMLAEPESTPAGVIPLRLECVSPAQVRRTRLPIPLDQRATLILTSGSSGHPKAVMHRLSAHVANARASQSVLPLSSQTCWLLSLPLFHIGGVAIVMRSMLHGSPIALPERQHSLLHSLQTLPVTHASLVATQLYRLLQAPCFHSRSIVLRHLMLGGGPISDSLLAQAQARGFTALLTYGMTETASQIITGIGQLTGRQPHIEWCLHAGQLHVKGASLFEGYYHRGTLTLPIDAHGYFSTRDTARIQHDELVITGRSDNLFISGGENIQPEEIEQHLLHHPMVEQAIVVPVDDAEFGQRPVALIKCRSPLVETELVQWLHQKVASFKQPIAYLNWPDDADTGLKPSRAQLQTYAENWLHRHNDDAG